MNFSYNFKPSLVEIEFEIISSLKIKLFQEIKQWT
jgi:hypothetical protein